MRVLFSRNFADVKFRENNTLRKWRNQLSFSDVGSHALVANFNLANTYFNPIRENKTIKKIFEFTVKFISDRKYEILRKKKHSGNDKLILFSDVGK